MEPADLNRNLICCYSIFSIALGSLIASTLPDDRERIGVLMYAVIGAALPAISLPLYHRRLLERMEGGYRQGPGALRTFEEDLEIAIRESRDSYNSSLGRSELTIEGIEQKIKLIIEILKSMPEDIDSKLSSAMLTTPPIIKDAGIFYQPEFLQTLETNFPEITDREIFKETLKELYLSFVAQEPDQRYNLILQLQQLIPQTTQSAELLNRGRASSAIEDLSSSSVAVAPESSSPLLGPAQQQAML